jgi:NADH:ubiquinone oxidoreductase subunit K
MFVLWSLIIVLSCLCIFSQKKHFLIVILLLEQIALRCYGVIMSLASSGLNRCGAGLRVLFLVMIVCEVGIGFGLLVRRSRLTGKDVLRRLFSL